MDLRNALLVYRVDNRLSNDESKLNVELTFTHMDEFNPVNVLQQVAPLRKLYEARQRLTDLLAKLDGNDALDALLQEVVENTDGLQTIKAEVGSPNGATRRRRCGGEGDSAPSE